MARRSKRNKNPETSGNKVTVEVTLASIMRSKAFRAGYDDAHRGRPFQPEPFVEKNQDWSYERGRMFAALYSGPLKAGHHLLPGAYDAFRKAYNSKDIL